MGLEDVELVMAVEKEFGVQLPDRECAELKTVGDLAALVVRHLPEAERGGSDAEKSVVSERVLERVRQVIVKEFRIPLDRVRAESNLQKLW